MRGALEARWFRFLAVLVLGVAVASSAAAIEFWDDRVSVHGYYETTLRVIGEDFSGDDDWDVTQWVHVLNMEIEAEIAPDGWGPFDLVSAFARIEIRFDCVWRRNCYITDSADLVGDRPGRQARRLSNARRSGLASHSQRTGDFRRYQQRSITELGLASKDKEEDSFKAVQFPFLNGVNGFFGIAGPDGVRDSADDPGLFTFEDMIRDECLFGQHKRKGSSDGIATRIMPITPGCKIRSIGRLRDKPHPLNKNDINTVVLGGGRGQLPLPFRPAPRVQNSAQLGRKAGPGEAQGLYVPSPALRKFEMDGEFDSFDQNFTVNELQWNRGASQQDEKELKELYFEFEMFDSALWIRAGKQSIVWGKTELFRTTDQFNPQDVALASLPTLEESRISLWSLRGIWSFYEVGPLEDVRFEVAFNYDQFEPTDLGRCGEPYTPRAVCGKTWGLFAHGFSGVGVAGEIRPPNPWNSFKGVEIGARLEFRWDRFSFAITDFYGYDDSFYIDPIFTYSRNVDPRTGRPRVGQSTGSCRTGNEKDCLKSGNSALYNHSINQTLFAMVCSSTVGVSDLDLSACAQNVFNSTAFSDPTNPLAPVVNIAVTNILSGQNSGGFFPITQGASVLEGLGGFTASTLDQLNNYPYVNRYLSSTIKFNNLYPGATVPTPLVPLVADAGDGPNAGTPGVDPIGLWVLTGLEPFLNDEQEALLGCGAFYRTSCDLDGIDLANAEASVLYQSWPVQTVQFGTLWDTTDTGLKQPGTTGFRDANPVGTRYEGGRAFELPGVRDGSTGGARHPFTGQKFKTELSILSWNFLMAAVALSSGDVGDQDVFDPDRPFRKGACSFRQPQFCSFVSGLIALTSTTRPSVRAGGNGRFGRRDMIWHTGSEVVLRYEKRNVFGVSMDFAEDLTKTNWGFEFTWLEGLPQTNNDAYDYHDEVNQFNLTVSVDRPTFINFLNANRTFFFNTQWFFRYVDNYTQGFTSNGPWSVLFTFAVSTGYFQDRLLPSTVWVYDFQSNSGAVLPQMPYRFTENFSATFGLAVFFGREEDRVESVRPIGFSSTKAGRHFSKEFVENGLTGVRERAEAFVKGRYTF